MQTLRKLWSSPGGAFLLILLAALLYWGGEYARRDLWAPDEARFAYVAQEMRDHGHWLVPHRHGVYYAHKPPLMFWGINAAATLFTGGEINAFATRFPCLLGGAASLWSVVMLMRLWGRREQDLAAAAVCATTYLFWKQGAWGQIDMLLCGFQMLALLALFAQDRKASAARAFAAYACMGLAILAKGPVGFAVPLGAYVAAKLAAGDRADLKRRHWMWGPLVTLLLPGVWLLLVWINHPPEGYLQELLYKQNVERAEGNYGHSAPFYYFLMYFPLDGLPWTLLLPFAWLALGGTAEDRALRRRVLGWIGFVIVLFSLSPGKRNLYILLVYPAAALLTAAAWGRLREREPAALLARGLRAAPAVLTGLLLLAALVSPWIKAAAPFPLLSCAAGLALMLALTLAAGRTVGEPAPAWRAALPWAVLFSGAGAFVLPAFNDHKTPRELIPLVARHLPPGAPLHLFMMNGENLTLYTHTTGKVLETEAEAVRTVAASASGLMVFEEKRWTALAPGFAASFDPHFFPLGGKKLVAASWPRGRP